MSNTIQLVLIALGTAITGVILLKLHLASERSEMNKQLNEQDAALSKARGTRTAHEVKDLVTRALLVEHKSGLHYQLHTPGCEGCEGK